MRRSRWRTVGAVLVLGAALAGCSTGAKKATATTAPPASSTGAGAATTGPATTTAVGSSTTTTAAASATTATTTPQTSGPRTVLSPTGLNVRAQPDKAAALLGTAAQGTVLTVLAHSDQGWFQVKGATVTGWISDSATLSAQGKLTAYQSSTGVFNAYTPTGWTSADVAPASVVFHAPAGGETIVVTSAASAAALGTGRSGYRAGRSEQVVACGVTTYLVPYTQGTGAATTATTTPPPGGAALTAVLVQVRIALDATHALGIDANLTDATHIQVVRDFVDSITFPFPQCEH